MMDIDLDLDSDRISDFLRSKLQEIRTEKTHLKSSLRHRENVSSEYSQQIEKNFTEHPVSLGPIWKKTINGKYVLGMEVRNDIECTLTNVTVSLFWTSTSPLNYTFHLLPSSTNFSSTPTLTQSGLIVVTLDIPLFIDHLSYTVFGSVSFQRNHKNFVQKFPSSVQLTAQDITDNSIFANLDGGGDADLLALALTSEKHELVAVTDGCPVESVLKKCGLSRLRSGLFVLKNTSSVLQGVLVEVQGMQIICYCKDFQVLVALVHHLHSVPGVVVIPKSLYRQDSSVDELGALLRVSLVEEIDQLRQMSGGDVKQLRLKMIDLEHETDVLVARINEKRCVQ